MFTYIDLCAGIGGFRLGIKNHREWKNIASCDVDENCNNTYKANYGTGFDFKDIYHINKKNLSYFDMLCAGFPCQPFSQAGAKNGFNDDRGKIFFKIIDIVSFAKPKVVLLENVPYILRHDSGKTLRTIEASFANLKYKLHYKVLNSVNFGVPQNRPRAFFVAFRQDIDDSYFSFTEEKCAARSVRDVLCIGDNSIPISKRWHEYIDLYTGIKDLSEMSFEVPKTRKRLERINKDVVLTDCIFQIRSSGIRAISIDGPYPTFAVSNSGGGAMIPVLSKEKRHISLIEIKRLMGFDDEFIFNVSRSDAIKQLANAVVPAVVESVVDDITKTLS